jgi:hypothetical protein
MYSRIIEAFETAIWHAADCTAESGACLPLVRFELLLAHP